jgi:regulation of enolase protein 1 (concanavalin A-like superfamily)
MRRSPLCLALVVLLGLVGSAMGAKPFQQDPGPDGIISMEAEHFDDLIVTSRGKWEQVGPTGGFTGEAGMQCNGAGVIKTGYATTSPGLGYNINFVATGTHYVWVRAWGATGNDDSCHVGLDGKEVTTGEWMSGWSNLYVWSSNATNGRARFEIPAPGVHTLNIWVREDGLIVDKIVVTTNVDYVPTDDGPDESPRGVPDSASLPRPANGATDVARDIVLSWAAGPYAATHDVYFGTVEADVANATKTDPLGVLVGPGQTSSTYDPPGLLDIEQTYYWRVDEVNAPPSTNIEKGAVWSFTTEPFVYRMTNIVATASSSAAGVTPANTVNGFGLNASDQHSMTDTTMWVSDPLGAQPTWIMYEFDRVYKMYEMWVWNYNVMFESVLGFGFKDVTIEYSTNGTDWTLLAEQEFARGAAMDTYTHNTTVDFGGVAAQYIRLTPKNNWGGLAQQYGLAEVQFYYTPAHPRDPEPKSGQAGVNPGVILNWRAGREAASHKIYFSEDRQAVADGTALVATVAQDSFDPKSLNPGLGKTYYWKVVEVNEAETPSSWEGDVWSFSTVDAFVVDDFESYANDSPFRVFQTWIDGLGFSADKFFPNGNAGNNTGAIVGYDPDSGNIMETLNVHGGRQSMPVTYRNGDSPYYSEAVRTWDTPQDWTIYGSDTLRLFVRGNPVRYVETPQGVITMSAQGADIYGSADEFTFAYKQLTGNGSITVRVDSVEYTDVWSKAGVMIRDGLDAGAKNALAYVTPDGRVGWQFRRVAADVTDSTRSEPNTITIPHWVRLTRDGTTITAAHSSDGVTWEPMVEAASPTEPSSLIIPMNATVYVGMALTSHVSGVGCTAQFSNAQASGASGAWEFAEIGIDHLLNDSDSLYVVLEDNAGHSYTVPHTNPDAVLVDTFQPWNIPLATFRTGGVNTAAITKMYIGVGKRNSTTPRGTGIIFVDDIGYGRAAPVE